MGLSLISIGFIFSSAYFPEVPILSRTNILNRYSWTDCFILLRFAAFGVNILAALRNSAQRGAACRCERPFTLLSFDTQ